jgi:hypothetical protein
MAQTDPASSQGSSTRALPFDLLRPTFIHVKDNQTALHSLCCTSKLFRQEVELLLYQHITFCQSDRANEALLNFCRTVTESPYLASLVRTIPMHIIVAINQRDLNLIARALRALVMLVDLTVGGYSVTPGEELLIFSLGVVHRMRGFLKGAHFGYNALPPNGRLLPIFSISWLISQKSKI